MPLTGVADLPLHDGHVPPWLAKYMKRMAKAILEVIVELYGPSEFIKRMSDPLWFQAFNNTIGMDWDSSGSTTVTIGIVKQVVRENPGLGIVVAGGKGQASRNTPQELHEAADKGLISSRAAEEAEYASRLAAKTDSVLLQDGYNLYHHAVLVSEDGLWTIVQQGMNPETRMARRYHWLRPLPATPTLEPHSAIAAARHEKAIPLDLTSRASLEARRLLPELVSSTPPQRLLEEVARAHRLAAGIAGLDTWLGQRGAEKREAAARLRAYYRPQPRPPRRIGEVLRLLHDTSPGSLEEMLLLKGVGPAVVRSLALVAELVYGVPVSHRDPASTPIDPFRYAYTVGGKDGVPYPFRRDYAEAVIEFLEQLVREARLDEKSRRRALARLQRLASLLPR